MWAIGREGTKVLKRAIIYDFQKVVLFKSVAAPVSSETLVFCKRTRRLHLRSCQPRTATSSRHQRPLTSPRCATTRLATWSARSFTDRTLISSSNTERDPARRSKTSVEAFKRPSKPSPHSKSRWFFATRLFPFTKGVKSFFKSHVPLLLNPSEHTSLFQRCNNIVDVQTTLYQHQNDVVCLLGKYTIWNIISPYPWQDV